MGMRRWAEPPGDSHGTDRRLARPGCGEGDPNGEACGMFQRETQEERARRQMVVDQLRRRGIHDPRVLEVMGTVPREHFVPGDKGGLAYEDRAVPLSLGQTVSQPYVVAAMTASLGLGPGDRVLEVGTGSGYQTAVLAALAGEVWTVERLAPLAREARERLEALGVRNVHYRVGDGSLGWAEAAPFDAIVVTAGAPGVPEPLKEQLSPHGGRMVIPAGGLGEQQLLRVVREGSSFRTEHLMDVRFVPLVGEGGWEGGGEEEGSPGRGS